jgi:hypothetical protein
LTVFPKGHTVQYVLSALLWITSVCHAEIVFYGSITVMMYLFVLGQISGPRRSSVGVLYGGYSWQIGNLDNSLTKQGSGEGAWQARTERNISTVLLMRRSWLSFFMSPRACDTPASVYRKSYILTFHADSGICYDLALSSGGNFASNMSPFCTFGCYNLGSLTV